MYCRNAVAALLIVQSSLTTMYDFSVRHYECEGRDSSLDALDALETAIRV